MIGADLVIDHCGTLLTLSGPAGPRRGRDMSRLGAASPGAVAMLDGRVVAAGERDRVLSSVQPSSDAVSIDAGGRLVLPGFVDPHTHAVFPRYRSWEYEARVGGKSYLEITREGGGIGSSVRDLRSLSERDLLERSRARLAECLALGTTTIEIKSGYGLSLESELKMLRVIDELARAGPMRVVSTFLGAHHLPEEYEGRRREYVDLVIETMIPRVAQQGLAAFNDVFCDTGFFDLEESRRVLEAGIRHGLAPKIHADELEELGGAALAAELGAVSADHLSKTGPAGMDALARSNTLAVLLPGTSFGLASKDFPDARPFIERGVAVALATDFNPGSSACQSMQAVIGLACSLMGMSPAEAITAATHNAACAMGLGGEAGSLEPGRRGDALVLDVEDFREVPYRFGKNHVHVVVAAGRLLSGLDSPQR
jgi:imidazolonepropionase